MEKLRIGAVSCALSLAKRNYFRTIELAFLFKNVRFRVSSLGHVQMAALVAVWLPAAASPVLLWGVFLQSC